MASTWKTSNNIYGSKVKSQSAPKKRIGPSTLQYLKQTDYKNFIHQQQNIAQRQRVGLFSQPLGLGPGDMYEDPKAVKEEKNFKINQKMQQKVGPQLFSKLHSFNIGDPYKDPFRANQLYLKQKTDMNMHDKAFLAGGKAPKIKHSQFEHQPQYDHKQYDTLDEHGKVKTDKKNFMTSNPKKGKGNTTTGHLFSTYGYLNDPFDNEKDKNKQEKLKHAAKIGAPFSTGKPEDKDFTPKYTLYPKDGEAEPYKDKDDFASCRDLKAGNWKYNNPNKKGYNGTFTAFPRYIEEGEHLKKHKVEEKIWRPNFKGTSPGYGQTLHRPCPPNSHLMLNDIKSKK